MILFLICATIGLVCQLALRLNLICLDTFSVLLIEMGVRKLGTWSFEFDL